MEGAHLGLCLRRGSRQGRGAVAHNSVFCTFCLLKSNLNEVFHSTGVLAILGCACHGATDRAVEVLMGLVWRWWEAQRAGHLSNLPLEKTNDPAQPLIPQAIWELTAQKVVGKCALRVAHPPTLRKEASVNNTQPYLAGHLGAGRAGGGGQYSVRAACPILTLTKRKN